MDSQTPVALPTVNWLLELLKVFGPAFVALLAAYLGFQLANKGRKYEILYKERFRGFEEVATYIFTLEDMLDNQEMYFFFYRAEGMNRAEKIDFFIERLNSISSETEILYRSRPGRKNLVLMSSHTQSAFNRVVLGHEALISFSNGVKHMDAEFTYSPKSFEKAFNELRGIFEQIRGDCKDAREGAFKDIDLPNK